MPSSRLARHPGSSVNPAAPTRCLHLQSIMSVDLVTGFAFRTRIRALLTHAILPTSKHNLSGPISESRPLAFHDQKSLVGYIIDRLPCLLLHPHNCRIPPLVLLVRRT